MPEINPAWASLFLLLAGNLWVGIRYLFKQNELMQRHTELHGEHQERLDKHQDQLTLHDRTLAVHGDRFKRQGA